RRRQSEPGFRGRPWARRPAGAPRLARALDRRPRAREDVVDRGDVRRRARLGARRRDPRRARLSERLDPRRRHERVAESGASDREGALRGDGAADRCRAGRARPELRRHAELPQVGRGARPQIRAGAAGVARGTARLYLTPGHGFEVEARVLAVSGRALAFDRTCFYPGGGGQPSDDGTVRMAGGDTLEIVSADADDDEIVWHLTRSELSPALVGQTATLAVNRARRIALTRYHTVLHVLNTIALRDYDG